MRRYNVLLFAVLLLTLTATQRAMSQQQQTGSDEPSFRLTSTLVFLDITVVDKSGNPVVQGLTKDDFTITEDNKRQRIFSFEAPESHVISANSEDDNPDGKAPITIFVLDRLNSAMDEFAQVRESVRTFLSAQPDQLASPAEMMVIGNDSLEMVQGYTRSKADLLRALSQVQSAIPFKLQHSDFDGERAQQSINALEQIAVQNKGVPGRKNVFWIGPGGPTLSRAAAGPKLDSWKPYVHVAENLLVEARISLFIIFPAMKVETVGTTDSVAESLAIGNNSPLTGDVNFALFARETGGGLFYNRNDLRTELTESQQLGSHYFTLTYRPGNENPDGKFRRIQVTLRDPNLRAVTKEGYFARDKNVPFDARQQTILNITEAAHSSIPITALEMKLSDVVRHPEAGTAQFVVHLTAKNLGWLPTADGKKTANLTMAMMSLSGNKNILASKFEKLTLWSTAPDPNRLAEEVRVRLTSQVPAKTQMVRIVLETADGGRMGTVDLDRKTIDAAPAISGPATQSTSPQPRLVHPSSPAAGSGGL